MKTIQTLGFNVFSDNLSIIPIQGNSCRAINTISPNSYGISTKDVEFENALKNSDYLVLDGVYFAFSSLLLHGKNIKKNQGPDVFNHFIHRLNEQKGKAFFLGSSENSLRKIKIRAKFEYPNISIDYFSPPFKAEFSIEDNDLMLKKINGFKPDILFIGMFKDIQKVCPGYYLTIDLNSQDIKSINYWVPNFKTDLFHTEKYFISELRKILDDTLMQQMRSDVPVGTYLSGGMDSSLVTIMASKLSDHRLKSFSGAFNEGPEFNELKYARIAAKKANSELFEIFPTEQEFIDLLPDLIYHLDEPVAGPGLFPQYIVSKFASNHVKVILGGQGGDEMFGGYARYLVAYLEQAIKGSIFESNEEAEHIVTLKSILPNLPSLKQYLPMIKNFWKEDAFEPMDRRYYNLINRMGATTDFLEPEFINGRNEKDIFDKFAQHFNNPDTKSYYNKMTQFDLTGSLPALLQVEDRVSMAVSIESRVPLLDRRIIDLISQIPAGLKFKGGELKYLMKRTVKDTMPPEILNRKDKMGFPVPLHIWAKGKSRDFIMDTLLSKKAKERNILNTKYIEKLINSEQPFSRGLWGLLSLEMWFNQFIDK